MAGVKREQDSGRKDAIGRRVMVSGHAAESRASAPPPPVGLHLNTSTLNAYADDLAGAIETLGEFGVEVRHVGEDKHSFEPEVEIVLPDGRSVTVVDTDGEGLQVSYSDDQYGGTNLEYLLQGDDAEDVCEAVADVAGYVAALKASYGSAAVRAFQEQRVENAANDLDAAAVCSGCGGPADDSEDFAGRCSGCQSRAEARTELGNGIEAWAENNGIEASFAQIEAALTAADREMRAEGVPLSGRVEAAVKAAAAEVHTVRVGGLRSVLTEWADENGLGDL